MPFMPNDHENRAFFFSMSMAFVYAITLFSGLWAQSKTWYFGNNAGVDFANLPAQAIDGPIQTNEGCAVVSNAKGRVIFSTDGRTIYDAAGVPVYSGLEGDISSTHSAIIIPHPKNPCERFFVFTVGSAENKQIKAGLHVAEVEVLNGQINVSASRKLHSNSTEKLAATPDGRGGYWVVSHDYIDTAKADNPQGRRFYAFHISAITVLNSIYPVVKATGSVHSGASPFGGNYWNSIGQMKFNEAGDMLALALYEQAAIEIFRFDKNTGQLYFITKLSQFKQYYPRVSLYGLEFSPNGKVLFASTGYTNPGQFSYLWAFDLNILNANAIWKGRKEVAVEVSTNQNKYPYGALQMGPDKAIYIARNGQPFLDRVNSPDNFINPDFEPQAIILKDTCQLGLPTLIKSPDCSNGAWPCSYFKVDISRDTAICREDSLRLGFDTTAGYTYRWSTGAKSSFIYGKPGIEYRVGVTDTAGCYATSFFTIPLAGDIQNIDVPMDTVLCAEARNSLSFAFPGVKYKWENGSTYEYSFEESDDVEVEFFNSCDTVQKLIHAEISECSCDIAVPTAFSPNFDLLNDQYELKAPCPLERYYIQIFNRWGEKVFESYDIHQSWNGTIGNKPAKPDTYLVLLEYESPLSDPVYIQKAVTLIR